MVTVEYRVAAAERDTFLDTLRGIARARRRNGAYDWGVFEDAADAERYVEMYLVDSWLEHLRQHERVTNADRALEDVVLRLQMSGSPKVTHFIAARATGKPNVAK